MQKSTARAALQMRAPIVGFVLALMVSATAESPDWLATPVTLSGEQLPAGAIIEHVVATCGISSMIAAEARNHGAIDLQLKDVPARAVLEALSMICADLEFRLVGDSLLVVGVKTQAIATPLTTDRGLTTEESAASFESTLPRPPAPPLPPGAPGSAIATESVQLAPEPTPGTEPITSDLSEFEFKPISLGDLHFKAGIKHLEAGEIELARACFVRALKENPDGDYELTPEQLRLLKQGE